MSVNAIETQETAIIGWKAWVIKRELDSLSAFDKVMACFNPKKHGKHLIISQDSTKTRVCK